MMKISLSFIRTLFMCLSVLFAISYTAAVLPGGLNTANTVIGFVGGVTFGFLLVFAEFLLKSANLRTLNITLIGLIIGYLLGEGVTLVWNTALRLNGISLGTDGGALIQTMIFFISIYFGVVLAVRASEEFYLSIPFVKFKAMSQKTKDLLMDATVLSESRILDLAVSGLLDEQLIVPKFVVKDLYQMLENIDENAKAKARRSLDLLKKLEGIPTLEMRYSEIDFPEISDHSLKLIHLARHLDANIITADISRFPQGSLEDIRMINIQILSHALKPITGEQLSIKIQRYGKEPRQGVGYLEDGTMVVVNGGAEYIGATVKTHVLSVKHTTSGRMVFCNVYEESSDPALSLNQLLSDPEAAQKNYYTVG